MRKKFYEVLVALGLKEKFEGKTLTNEEFSKVLTEYQQKFGTELGADIAAEQRSTEQQQLLDSIYQALSAVVPDGNADNSAGQQHQASLEGVIAAINNLGVQFKQVANKPAADTPAAQGTLAVLPVNGPGTTTEYLFGIEVPMFSMQHRWNRIAANPGAAASLGTPSSMEAEQFRQAVCQFGQSLRERVGYLLRNGMTSDLKALATGTFSTNYAGVDGLGDLGTQYTVRRQDAIIARILSTRQLSEFFPVRYGIQDNDVIFNAFFDEVSQSWQAGEVYKGGMKIDNERGYVDDAMIKMKWGPMKELERKYIAYLNTSGSDPIKWSMVEYQILNSLLEAQREQNIRRMRGIYVAPETGVASSYLNASTGILYRLLDYVHSNRILLHADADYQSYTKSTMLAAVQAFVADVQASLSDDETLDKKVLYLNERHKTWWIECVRTKYGKDTDFSGPTGSLQMVPDTDLRIIWLPYLGKQCLMLIQEPGNLQFLEFIPGEMMNIQIEQQMEMVRAWSTWKEGTSAALVGRKFQNHAALVANNYEWQQIFLNKFSTPLAADATTVDASNNFWFETAANTKATAITDITGAKTGVAYCIECGSTTNATTIAKSGKFADLSAAWTPTAVGDYVLVILRSNGKFAELERMVNGTRTINSTLQPNYVG
ncbi:MAG: hypothetical protein J5971_01070 [Prevotella sp.]|nr:hypothetical protein [Prevotella sp.]